MLRPYASHNRSIHMKRAPRILLAGGGTGGHVYPAIAIADAIRALVPEAALAFAGTQDHLEWDAMPKAGYAIHPITVSGFHRKQPWRNLSFPFKLIKGLAQSWQLIGDFDADVAVGTGGYVSGPVLMAASLRGRPVVVQEQNAYAGVTNRLLAKRAAQIHIAFSEAKQAFPPEKCRLSGNPTRAELRHADRAVARAAFEAPGEASLLLVLGGSLGSLALNTAMETHLASLLADDNVYVVWQTGRIYYERLRARVPQHPRLRLLQYIDRMDLAYAAADVALCRAGAITCSELMHSGYDGLDSFGYTINDGNGETASATVNIDVNVAPPGVMVHVYSIDMTSENANGPFWRAIATVTVHDLIDGVHSGVVVNGEWSGSMNDSDSCVTDSFGVCSVNDKSKSNSDAIFTITSLSGAGFVHTGPDHETSDSIGPPP